MRKHLLEKGELLNAERPGLHKTLKNKKVFATSSNLREKCIVFCIDCNSPCSLLAYLKPMQTNRYTFLSGCGGSFYYLNIYI